MADASLSGVPVAMKSTEFHITELDCSHEVALLKKRLAPVAGIAELEFDVVQGRMVVRHDPKFVTQEEILRHVTELGMHAQLNLEGNRNISPIISREGRIRWFATILSGVFIVTGFLLRVATTRDLLESFSNEWPTGSVIASIAFSCFAIATLIGLGFVLPKAWRSLKTGSADMNVLMSIALIGAVIIGEWLEAAAVSFLFLVALSLEQWSMGRARSAIAKLTQLTPTHVTLVDAELGLQQRAIDTVEVGDAISVRPGDRIPLDGVILNGVTDVNQAPITGESLPVQKSPGDEVYAGTINGDGQFAFQVSHKPDDTTLARIVHSIQKAQSSRAPLQQTIDRFAQYYTPGMIGLALLVGMGGPWLMGGAQVDWLYRALVVLVIGCPCALVISTPVTIVAALTSAVRQGVLIKGGKYLEAAASIRSIALDKTGTLTEGRPRLQSVVSLDGCHRDQSLAFAASIESHSSHPIASAILDEANALNLDFNAVDDFRNVPGEGAHGNIDGDAYWIGSPRIVTAGRDDAQFDTAVKDLEHSGRTVVALVHDDRPCSLLAMEDRIRDNASEAIRQLRREGVERIVMLTGDRQEISRRTADQTGVDDFLSEALPQDKQKAIIELKRRGGLVAMIGDGINDGPAMATADIAIAMGQMGTDTAIETADIALMTDDLAKVSWLIRHSRRTISVIRQNIVFAIGTKLLVVALAALGMATLWMAIAADMGTSLLVIFSGLRMLRPRD